MLQRHRDGIGRNPFDRRKVAVPITVNIEEIKMSNISENNATEVALNCRVLRTHFQCGHSSLSVEEIVSAPAGMKNLLNCKHKHVHMVRTHELEDSEPEAPTESLVVFGMDWHNLSERACQILEGEFGGRDGMSVSKTVEGDRINLWVTKDNGDRYHESKYCMGTIVNVAAVMQHDGMELSPEHAIWHGGFWDFQDMSIGGVSDDVNGELADWMANRKPYPKLVA